MDPEESLLPFKIIGTVKSPFTTKMSTPRQSGLLPVEGTIVLTPDFRWNDSVVSLESFSHIWILFVFDQHAPHAEQWRPMVRTPRPDVDRVGVFATRSPHRPNPIGMSVVELKRVRTRDDGTIEIDVSGLDILNDTAVLDIKPYIPYTDSVPGARADWAAEPPKRYAVNSTAVADRIAPEQLKLIESALSFDPRTGKEKRKYPIESSESNGLTYKNTFNLTQVHWTIANGQINILSVENFLIRKADLKLTEQA